MSLSSLLTIQLVEKIIFFSDLFMGQQEQNIICTPACAVSTADRPNKLPASTSFITFVLVVSAFR